MVSSSRVWVWIGGSSPARTRHSTTAQSPPDCSPASLSSVLVPLPWVTVRPAPGPERTASLRAMLFLLDWERISMERRHDPSINLRSRSRDCFRGSAGGGPGARSSGPFGRSPVVVAGGAGAGDLYGHAGRRRLVRPSIRFMGVAARTEARKRRVNLVRQLLRRRHAGAAPSPVPHVTSRRDTGGRSTPSS